MTTYKSISLQIRVYEISVPEHHAINPCDNLVRRLAALTQHERSNAEAVFDAVIAINLKGEFLGMRPVLQ